VPKGPKRIFSKRNIFPPKNLPNFAQQHQPKLSHFGKQKDHLCCYMHATKLKHKSKNIRKAILIKGVCRKKLFFYLN